jgi:hypothetical protein
MASRFALIATGKSMLVVRFVAYVGVFPPLSSIAANTMAVIESTEARFS